MIKAEQLQQAANDALIALGEAGIVLTPEERGRIEVADFGLSELEKTGLQILTYLNTERCCAKELVLSPGQTCPEHRHPAIEGRPGKEETFRCRRGTVYLNVPGEPTAGRVSVPPANSEPYYTVFHEICLKPGEQYTLQPDTLHWFQAGPDGAIVSEFSTRSTDEADIFSDPRIVRQPQVEHPSGPAAGRS